MLDILWDKGSCHNFANFPTQVGTCFASGFCSWQTVLCPHPWRRTLRRRCFRFCGTESRSGRQISRCADLKCQQLQWLPSIKSGSKSHSHSKVPSGSTHFPAFSPVLIFNNWVNSWVKKKKKILSHHWCDLYFSLLAKLTSYHRLSNYLHFLFRELFAHILWVFFYGA